ncbi:extracellular calcium-sensing receptor-like [Huso huso]|uniref:Extracellular calcium-sensing receptor-like n=1 Tax=Huso huso TaxID=61971 RepID=A0ABR0YL68_HUSHU
MSSSAISSELAENSGTLVHPSTVWRSLVRSGLHGRLAAKKPYLRRGNKAKRLNYARKHRNWGAEKWQQVLWTDESKFEIIGCSRRQFVRRRAGEWYTNECLQATVKHGGGSLQVWGCISANGVGDLVRINGLLNAEKYRQILIHHAIPSGRHLIGPKFILQHDNDPRHTAKVIKNYLQHKEEQGVLEVMASPILTPTAQNEKKRISMSAGLEILGLALCVFGWIAAIITCALPMWRVTSFIGSNIVTSQTIWEGLWTNCVVQSTGQMQCKIYDSMLALPQDLQTAQALTVISIILALLAILISIVGARCTTCIEDEGSKAKVMIISGVLFIIAGVMQLIPVSWSANTIVRDFYNPLLTDAQRRDFGSSLYSGWAAAVLLILGGALLCCSCPPREKKYAPSRMAYSAARSNPPSGYDKKDYV